MYITFIFMFELLLLKPRSSEQFKMYQEKLKKKMQRQLDEQRMLYVLLFLVY